MEKVMALGVSVGTTGIGIILLSYMRYMRSKSRRHVLRPENMKGLLR